MASRKRGAKICSSCQKPLPALVTLSDGHSVDPGGSDKESTTKETPQSCLCTQGVTIRSRPQLPASSHQEQEESKKYCIKALSPAVPTQVTLSNGLSVDPSWSDEESTTEGTCEARIYAHGASIRRRPQLPTSSHLDQEESEKCCALCINPPSPAVKICLQCEAFLCDGHLTDHKSKDHMPPIPIPSIKKGKCTIHNKVLQCFCCEDAMFICTECHLTGEHKGHQTEPLNKAFNKKMENLRSLLEQLTSRREKMESRGQSLLQLWELEKEKVSRERQRATSLFSDIRRHVDVLENSVDAEISRLEDCFSRSVSDLIQELEIQRDELSKQIHHFEDLLDTADPLSILLDQQMSDMSEHEDFGEMVQQKDDNVFTPIMESIHGLVSITVHKRLRDMITESTKLKGFFLEEVSDMKLDEKTSARDLEISADQKMARWPSVMPQALLRKSLQKKNKHLFECSQVLSTRTFSSGRHYWEVETGEGGGVRLGVTYANATRRGVKFPVGENEKSWCLRIWYKNYSAIYRRQAIPLNQKMESNKVGIFLDYQAGQLSFYEVDSRIRHLHTFKTTFTEPLYAAFWIYNNCVKVVS